jgi:hypothetical protein
MHPRTYGNVLSSEISKVRRNAATEIADEEEK